MLKPLEQFICDHCKIVISKPEEGYLSWVEGDSDYGIKIVHNLQSDYHNHSKKKCFPENGAIKDGEISQYLGTKGLGLLLTYFFDKDRNILKINDLNNFIEIIKRLQIPYYEEARMYFQIAKEDEYFVGENEQSVNDENFLKVLIEKYSHI